MGVGDAAASQPVTGSLESVSSGVAKGWAVDLDSTKTSIAVQLYLDGPAGSKSAQLLGTAQANLQRTDIAYPGAHGFSFSIPSQYLDGQSHVLYVYGVDMSGMASEALLLSNAPLSFVASGPTNSTRIFLDNGTIRIGLQTNCGGTLAELRYQGGPNLINNYDCTGRQVQAAFYDGNHGYDLCSGCSGVWGWDPVQGGDKYNQGSVVTSQSVTATSLYIATRPLEWNPDNKGGGPGAPVVSDVLLEQWVSLVPEEPRAVLLHYRIRHLGADTHAHIEHEFPAVYVNRGYDYFLHYGGTAPWTNGEVTNAVLGQPGEPASYRYTPENWVALVNALGVGLTVYTPRQYPYFVGWQGDGGTGEFAIGTNYVHMVTPFTFGPQSVLEGDVYLIAGDYRMARNTIVTLRNAAPGADFLPPIGWLDNQLDGRTVIGDVLLSGWAFDDTQVAAVEVLVDGALDGIATYGAPRPDVAGVYPNAPLNVAFAYVLNTTRYPNGLHTVTVRATDTSGHVSILPWGPLTIDNPLPQPPADTTAPIVTITNVSQTSRSLTVTVSASDDVGVTRVDLLIDGQLIATDLSSPYTFRLNTRTFKLGAHQITATGVDAAGNLGTSPAVSWTR